MFSARPAPAVQPLRVAVLVDLPRTSSSGGHVKGWERRAEAVAASSLPLDLTIFFSGEPKEESLSPHVHLRQLPAVFSTKNLSFLPYVPDHTDLAPYHPALARALSSFDVIHTTDAYFAFARTAERVAKKHGIPLVTSFHTDTPSYARIFTRNTLTTLFGRSRLARFLIETCRLPERQEAKMLARLRTHLSCCTEALLVRPEDAAIAQAVVGPKHVHELKVVSDKTRFCPSKADRAGVEATYGIPAGQFLALFVGRLDVGKNIYTLIDAMERLIARGVPIHLITAGLGPAQEDLKTRLGAHVTVAGFVPPDDLARIMASCDVLAFPSEVEIRSFVSVEALASGLPVLVSEKSGIASLIRAQSALAPISGGPDAWAEALEHLVTHPQDLTRRRADAVLYTKDVIASWEEIMRDDFLATWQKAFAETHAGAHDCTH